MPLTDQLRLMAGAHPDEVAYGVLAGGELTFGDWEAEASSLARGLGALGVSRSERVAIGLATTEALRWLVAYAGIHKAGAVVVPLNPRLSDREITTMLHHAGASCAIVSGELLERMWTMAPQLLDLRLVVDAGGAEPASRPAPTTPGPQVVAWADLLDADRTPYQVEVSEDDLADILYTSGTTGAPKGVAVRHRSASLLPVNLPRWTGERWLHASPLFTFAGISFIYNPMKLGMSGLYQPRFEVDPWLDAVEHYRPTAVFLVPSMAQLLVTHERFEKADLSSVKLCAIGSAPLAPGTLRRLQDRMPEAAVSNSYGMTEAGAAYCAMPKGEAVKRVGSVGKPMAPMEVRCVDEAGREVAAGEVGEVLIRMPGREREYFRDPEATSRTWAGGWLHTGDLGRLDDDGYLYIVGRRKEVIIRGGNNVHAADVESVILEHPMVAEAAVIGVPHEVLGEDLVAFVVPVPSGQISEVELRDHCLEHLADYKSPRRFILVGELPRNATGKVMKHLLVVPPAG